MKEATTTGGASQTEEIPWFLPPTLQGHPAVESRSQGTGRQRAVVRAPTVQIRAGEGGGSESTGASHWHSGLG